MNRNGKSSSVLCLTCRRNAPEQGEALCAVCLQNLDEQEEREREWWAREDRKVKQLLREVDYERRIALSMLRYHRKGLRDERERVASWKRCGLGEPDGWPLGYEEGWFGAHLWTLRRLRYLRRGIVAVMRP